MTPLNLQVELLIKRAGTLLDRCLVDRAVWQQLNVERFRTGTDLLEFIVTDWLSLQDERAGGLRQTYLDYSGYELPAEQARLTAATKSFDDLGDQQKWYTGDASDDRERLAENTALNSYTAPFTQDEQVYNPDDPGWVKKTPILRTYEPQFKVNQDTQAIAAGKLASRAAAREYMLENTQLKVSLLRRPAPRRVRRLG